MIFVYIYIYIYREREREVSTETLKLATAVEGDPKAPFSVATTPGEGATPFPGLLHFTLDTYLILLSVKKGDIKYHF